MNTSKIFTKLALGAALVGVSIAPRTASAHGAKAQKVTVTFDGTGYKPANLSVKAGQEVHMTFVSKGEGCGNSIVIPSLKKSVNLKRGQSKTISFTPKKGQTIAFACSMKMFKGKVTAK